MKHTAAQSRTKTLADLYRALDHQNCVTLTYTDEHGEITIRTVELHELRTNSDGGIDLLGAERAVDNWKGARARLERQHADTVDSLRALQNGKPVPEHVKRHMREDALRMIRRNPLDD